MFTALLILQVLMGIAIIGLVLLQQGKGADMGAAFGAGASGTVFGAAGGGSFFTRVTAVLAALFFANSILLSSPLVRHVADSSASVTRSAPATEESDVPVIEEQEQIDIEETDLPPADVQQPGAESAPVQEETPSQDEVSEQAAPALEEQTDLPPATAAPAEGQPAPSE
jgi:preprotein translocase subunit SecG